MIARSSGILMPIFSLPSPHGIGTLGKEAYSFIDFLSQAGQHYWQMLPTNPTSYGDSPYQSFSAFAANPYFIDLDLLQEDGLLTIAEIDKADLNGQEGAIDYAALFERRIPLLQLAATRFDDSSPGFQCFCRQEAAWLEDYALFMSIKAENGHRAFTQWPEALRLREPEALEAARSRLAQEIRFWKVVQYLFHLQWEALRAYARTKEILFIGDIPIYVSPDSSDLWAAPELFQVDEKGVPTEVAGCPPDAFSAEGQLWGNPLYNWEAMKQDGYCWWMRRLRSSFQLFDVIRIDHFRGFESYYAVPYGAKNAVHGRWCKGPDLDFIRAIHHEFGKNGIIAEDLGFLTREVRALLRKSAYPGMKILQFAFDSREESDYMPHNYPRNCVVYTGTHDNDTICGWLHSAPRADVRCAFAYLGVSSRRNAHWAFIRAALSSVADLAVIPMQDYLGLGSEARINIPSTLGGNWCWRMLPDAISPELADKIASMTRLYGRLPKNKKRR